MTEWKGQIGRNDDGRGTIFCAGGSLKGSQRGERGGWALQLRPASQGPRMSPQQAAARYRVNLQRRTA